MKNALFKKGFVVGIIVLFIGIIVIPSNANVLNVNISTDDEVFSIPMNSRGIIYVDDNNTEGPWDGTLNHPFQYIQDGVDKASEGDTVYVFNGTYYECIVIGKSSIKLVGENVDSTIIDGKGCDSVIFIKTNSDFIHICQFTIKNGNKGIRCYSNYNKIYKNIISNNKKGIEIYDCSNCIVNKNHIHNNTDEGIVILGSTLNSIKYNDIRSSETGILLDFLTFTGDSSFLNRIEKNNLINNWDNVCFYYHTFRLPNQWKRNYWDDYTGLGPKIIYGFIFIQDLYSYSGEYKLAVNLDWHPAKEPYKIIITNNIEGCGIE